MARTGTTGQPNDPAYDVSATVWNAHVTDYVSQSDANPQVVVGGFAIGSGMTSIAKLKLFTVSGTNPITFAHGMGGTPKCIVSANAVQPYAIAWNSNGTNIIIYHNAAASLSVTVLAWI